MEIVGRSYMGAGGETVNRAVYNAIDALIRQRVEFGVINEMSLKDLPPSAKAVFLPVPYLLSDDAFAGMNQALGRLERFWVDQILYKL